MQFDVNHSYQNQQRWYNFYPFSRVRSEGKDMSSYISPMAFWRRQVANQGARAPKSGEFIFFSMHLDCDLDFKVFDRKTIVLIKSARFWASLIAFEQRSLRFSVGCQHEGNEFFSTHGSDCCETLPREKNLENVTCVRQRLMSFLYTCYRVQEEIRGSLSPCSSVDNSM